MPLKVNAASVSSATTAVSPAIVAASFVPFDGHFHDLRCAGLTDVTVKLLYFAVANIHLIERTVRHERPRAIGVDAERAVGAFDGLRGEAVVGVVHIF